MASERKMVNAFSLEYLEAVQVRDDPSTALESETAEPWEVRAAAGRYGLFRPWEKVEEDVPRALFRFEETAWLFRVIWPALGRDRTFRLRSTPAAEGYPVEMGDTTVAFLRGFDPDAVFAAHLASYLIRSPQALGLLVWLAGPTAQQEMGRMLADLASGPGGAAPDPA
ncbi:MAG TPA: hypothetical protein VHC97_25230 [Thermoanaerobaculia bacterium]|jgi:hypothetical protein|nr:hypothetical protein [Thermoanaerobaculia bacterium]